MRKARRTDGCARPQQGVVAVVLVDPVGDEELPRHVRVAFQVHAQVRARHQGDVGAVTQHHQQVAVVGVGQHRVEFAHEVLRVRVEPGKAVVVAAVEGQALAIQAAEVVLATAVALVGDEDFGVLQAHVDACGLEVLPAPAGVLEHRHVDAPTLEVAEAPRDGRGQHDEAVVRLGLVEGLQQFGQQAGGRFRFRLDHIGREVGAAHLDHLGGERRFQ